METNDTPAEAATAVQDEKGEALEERREDREESGGLSAPEGETVQESEETVDLPADTPAEAPADCRGEAPKAAHRDELKDLLTLYPDLRLSEIPEEVIKSPLPVAAAYALYRRKIEREREIAEVENRKNRERAAGGIRPSGEIYYSPSEVRRMTQKEVRSNYDAILRSMQTWR